MNTQVANTTEYRDLPLSLLSESTTNPRRRFDEDGLKGTGRNHPQPGRSLSVARPSQG
jgi:hypothetical protein